MTGIRKKRMREEIKDVERQMDERLSRIEVMIQEQGKEITKSAAENKKFMWGIMWSVIGVVAATFLGIYSIVSTFISVLIK